MIMKAYRRQVRQSPNALHAFAAVECAARLSQHRLELPRHTRQLVEARQTASAAVSGS
jgi:hypothetical protein